MTRGVDLSALNTLGLPARADRLVVIEKEAQLVDLLASEAPNNRPLRLLGGGSNVVLKSYLPGTVAVMRTRGIRWERAGRGFISVTVAAGERWHDLVRCTLGQGWSGLENLALIPGSVGAAPMQNIGAYGVELADRFVRLRALDSKDGSIHFFDADACGFGYRDSRFKAHDAGRFIVLEITLTLSEKPRPMVDYPDVRDELRRMGCDEPSALQIAEAVVRIRRRKLPDPRIQGNAGSFFKNPVISGARAEELRLRHPHLSLRHGDDGRVKLSAAQLIDGCGWKGQHRGRVGVWQRQPLVLINLGGATAAEVLQLAEAIRKDVADRYGVDLEIEPRIIGEDWSQGWGQD